MNRIVLMLFLVLLSATSVFGRETVKGTVVDGKGEPIPGVKVEIPGSTEYTFTDLDGAFQILLRDPVKNLNFSYPGFGTSTHRVRPEMKVVLGKGWEGHTKGFRGMIDIEGGIGFKGKATFISGNNEARNLHTFVIPGESMTFGYQINRHLFIGAGFGIYLDLTRYEEYSKDYEYYYNWKYTELAGLYMPLFLSARWDFGLTRKTAPYIGLRVGYMQYINDDQYVCYVSSYDGKMSSRLEVRGENCGSLYFSPSVGYRMSLRKKTGLNLGISYMAGMKRKFGAEASFGNSNTYLDIVQRGSDAILFNIGVDF